GSIANEAGISGSEIGPIEIRDEITYVSIPARYRDDVLAKLGGTRFRGRPVNLRVAAPERPAGDKPRYDRKPPAGKFQRDDRPREGKPFRSGNTFVPEGPGARGSKAFRPGASAPPRGGKPFPPKGKPFSPKGKPFPPKGKPK